MSTAAVPVASGLFAANGEAVPLVGVSVAAQIRDFAARVVLTQCFRNVETQPIEAVYKFPLDEAAGVCGFEAEIGGRRVVGRVEEREKAFEAYDEALASGHGAYLLDEERADIFTVSVGNVPPGAEVVLRITTVAELSLEGDDIRFTLPTTIAPRYAPAEDARGVGETEASRVNGPVAIQVPYGLSLEIDLEMSEPVRSVESPSHPISMSLDGRRAKVALSARETAMDRDFVLKIGTAGTRRPAVLVERGADDARYALLSFQPRFEARPAPCEVVFVVDQSGSMQGPSIAEAKNALQLCLRSLQPGCRFNIVGFGSSFDSLFPESRPYDDASLKEASEHVRELEADKGGTEILGALEFVLGQKPVEGLPKQVFVLTDGEVSNTDAVIALVGQHALHARVFTFGIGAGASQHLVKGVARAGGGVAEFIAPGERIEAKVMRQFGRALSVALRDVRVEWGSVAVEQAPHLAPPVFAGGRVLLYGRLPQLAAPATVALVAKGPEGDMRFDLPIELPSEAAAPSSLVATLWARARIRDLEEGASALHAPRGSRQARAKSVDDRARDEVIRLGKEYGLVSRHTSYVAIEERTEPTTGEIVLRKVPSALTRGWHGTDQVACATMVMGARVAGTSLHRAPAAGPRLLERLMGGRPGTREGARATSEGASFPRYGVADPRFSAGDDESFEAEGVQYCAGPAEPSVRPLDELIGLQAADGSWAPSDELARVTGVSRAQLDDLATAIGARPGVPVDRRPKAIGVTADELRELLAIVGSIAGLKIERLLATLVALRWLERHCADTVDEWGLAAEKSRAWVRQTAGAAASSLERLVEASGA